MDGNDKLATIIDNIVPQRTSSSQPAVNNSPLEVLIGTTSNSVNNIAPQEATGTETEMLVVKSEALAK